VLAPTIPVGRRGQIDAAGRRHLFEGERMEAEEWSMVGYG
jgi:hypothetical protein